MMMPGLEIHILRGTHERAEMTFDDGGEGDVNVKERETFLPLPSSKCGRRDDKKKKIGRMYRTSEIADEELKKYKSAKVLI